MKYPWLVAMNRQSEMSHNVKEALKRKMESSIRENFSVSTSTKKTKRYRSAFTTEQLNYLETEFKKFAYIGSTRRKELSELLNIPERAIKIWFQNRRMKVKKDASKGSDDEQKNLLTDKSEESVIRKQLINDSKLSTNDREMLSCVTRDTAVVETNVIVNNVLDMTSKLSTSQNKVSFCNKILQQTKAPECKAGEPNDYFGNMRKYLAQPKCKKNNENTVIVKQEIDNQPDAKLKLTDDNDFVTSSCQSLGFSPYVSSGPFPQDLTSKANMQFLQSSTIPFTDITSKPSTSTATSNVDKPLYLNGIYAQPYFPPGNMMWKPINVAPIMSTGVSTIFGSNLSTSSIPGLSSVPLIGSNIVQSETFPHSVPKKNCNCDCHEKAASPVIVQHTNAIPQVQYVITALPFQNGTEEFGNN